MWSAGLILHLRWEEGLPLNGQVDLMILLCKVVNFEPTKRLNPNFNYWTQACLWVWVSLCIQLNFVNVSSVIHAECTCVYATMNVESKLNMLWILSSLKKKKFTYFSFPQLIYIPWKRIFVALNVMTWTWLLCLKFPAPPMIMCSFNLNSIIRK